MTKTKIKHLGFIMDGNRRWAKKRGLPSLMGHKKGYQIALKIGEACLDRGIEMVTFWAFSTENWKRSKTEVSYLMKLLKQALSDDIKELVDKNIRLRVIGRLNDLPKDLQEAAREAMELTKNNTRGNLNLAISYGGQAEIVDGINKLIKEGVKKVTPESFAEYLYDPQMPAPDLIIRTSGEARTSGFLLWHSAYSELYFTQTPWPAFSEKDLNLALEDFAKRQRRFGGN